MSYSKEMAAQNRQLLARAKELLVEVGYSLEKELAHYDPLSGSTPNSYIRDMNGQTARRLAEEYPDVTRERVNRRVARAMRELRAQLAGAKL